VLDIATGIGEPSITAAKVVGTAGHVLAADISRQMLAIAKVFPDSHEYSISVCAIVFR
jgi:ubiquinone/menaquinone biosynthesis C-methylase UbiE